MREDAQPVDVQSLGVDDRGISAETILDTYGNATIQNAEGSIVLDQGQVQSLVAFLISHMEVDA